MKSTKPLVQIGPVSDDPAESVSSVNKSFMNGLAGPFDFVAPSANRRFGNTRQARFNAWNVFYLASHLWRWFWNLALRRPDIVHYGITTGWALDKGLLFLRLARMMGAKTVGHLHSGDFEDFWRKLPERRRRAAARELKRLDAFVVLSEHWQKVAAECAAVERSRIHVVNNPIDPDFEREALAFPVSRGGNSILSLGVMGRDKGVLDIVEAAALVRRTRQDFEIVLAGPERDPGIRDLVFKQIAQSGLSDCVQTLPAVHGTDKFDLFRKTGIFLLPSYFENFPLVVLEAAAAGHAIIATPVGAIPEFFEDGVSALFVEPRNPEQLASAILRLLENPAERLQIASAGRAVFEKRLGKRGILSALEGVYRQVLERTGPGERNASVLQADS